MAVFDVVGGAEPGNDREEDHDTRHNLKYTRSCHDPGSVPMNGIISMNTKCEFPSSKLLHDS